MTKRLLVALAIGFGLAGVAYVLNTGGQSSPGVQAPSSGSGPDPYRNLRIN